MRRVFVLLLALSLSLLPCLGCGESKPDPRDNPDFVDDSDPNVTLDMMEADAAETAPGGGGAETP